MKNTNSQKNVDIALQLFTDEVNGDLKAAIQKMDADYMMTWAYVGYDGKHFPNKNLDDLKFIKDVYAIKGRKYEFKNVCANGNTVMLELIESYPDDSPEGGEFRTPLVIVLEFSENKVIRGRHYCDPRISDMKLSESEILKLFE